MPDNKLTAGSTKQLPDDQTPKLKSSDDLAVGALSQAARSSQSVLDSVENVVSKLNKGDEASASDEFAQTLHSLQNLIERSATRLTECQDELKQHRESLSNVFDNDQSLSEATEMMKEHSKMVKERKSQLQQDPQVTSIKLKIADTRKQKKEIEEDLSRYLVSYYQLTNSTSVDTSDGDQWDFSIKAKMKRRSS